MESLLRSETTTVSQTIDDDDTESFFVVARWDSQTEPPAATAQSANDGAAAATTPESADSPDETLTTSGRESRGSLENVEMMKSALSTMDDDDADTQEVQQNRQQMVITTTAVPMSVSQTSTNPDGNNHMGEDAFSMTNYSTASSASDNQLEELQNTLTVVINEHKKLKEVLEKQNLELELRQTTIEELKSLSSETVNREKTKSEQFCQLVEKLQKERDSAMEKLQEVSSACSTAAASTIRTASDFEVIETLENQLKQRDDIIQQNGEQVKELSARLGQTIVTNDELKELIRKLEDDSKRQSDSLSSSDEGLAKCFAHKEKLEGDLQEVQHAKMQLQQEVAHLRDQFAAVNAERERLQGLGEQLESKCLAIESHCENLDAEKQQLNIQLAALRAEMEQQAKVLSDTQEENKSLLEEKVKLQRDVNLVTEMLEARTNEIRNHIPASSSTAAMSASSIGSSISSFPGQIVGLMRGVSKSYGIRDENDDPNESFGQSGFEHVTAPTAPAPVPAPRVQQEENKCPICLRRFDSLRKLTYHASSCGMGDPFVFP